MPCSRYTTTSCIYTVYLSSSVFSFYSLYVSSIFTQTPSYSSILVRCLYHCDHYSSRPFPGHFTCSTIAQWSAGAHSTILASVRQLNDTIQVNGVWRAGRRRRAPHPYASRTPPSSSVSPPFPLLTPSPPAQIATRVISRVRSHSVMDASLVERRVRARTLVWTPYVTAPEGLSK